MATSEDLDAEVAAAILVQTTLAQRLISDYDDADGEYIPHGVQRFRQRVDYLDRQRLGSNEFTWSCNVNVDGITKMSTPFQERSFTAALRASQRVLTDPTFWGGLASVFQVNQGTDPQTVEEIVRTGLVLRYTVSVQVVLSPL